MRSILSMLTNLEADTAKGGLMKEKDVSPEQLETIQRKSTRVLKDAI